MTESDQSARPLADKAGPIKRVVIDRKHDPEYGDVFVVSSERGEIDRTTDLEKVLRYTRYALRDSR